LSDLQREIQEEERRFGQYVDMCMEEWKSKQKPLMPVKIGVAKTTVKNATF
jgi:hypothetical protein